MKTFAKIFAAKNFAVYEKSEQDRVAVKVGFCWPGLIWSWAWLLFARLWERAGIVGGCHAIVYVIALSVTLSTKHIYRSQVYYTGAPAAGFMLCAVALITGWIIAKHGNEWRRTNLRARGFDIVAVVKAESKDGACAKLHEMSPDDLSVAKEKANASIAEIESKRDWNS